MRTESLARAGRAGEAAARSPWVERAARLGYLVRGLLYLVMGFLALQVAQGADREASQTDQQGALRLMATTPLGSGLLVVAALGLAGYAVWGVVRAVFDPLGKGSDAKGLAQRAAFLVSGVAHVALCAAAVRLLTSTGGQDGGGGASMTAWLMGQPLWPWLVGISGVWMVGAGLAELYVAYTKDFRKDLRREAMGASELSAATNAGRAGMTARGVVFGLIGVFLVQAALNADANRARGVDGALEALAGAPYGPVLLGLVAAGLAAYGVYSALCARWMRIPSA